MMHSTLSPAVSHNRTTTRLTTGEAADVTAVRAVRPYLSIALFALTVAATTGAFLRFGLGWGMPAWASNYTAIRHAHSHLMYFGWATLAMMALVWRFLPHYTGQMLRPRHHWQLRTTSLLALLSFPAFWVNGYGLTQIGPARLPLGSMAAMLNGVMWYWFAWLYWRQSRALSVRPLPVQLWDWAILLLLLSSGGALGLVAMVLSGVESIFLQQAFLHLFLDLFAVGWFSLCLLGLLWAWIDQREKLPARLPIFSLALTLAPTFFLGLAPLLVPAWLFWIAAGANGVAALLLGRHIVALWRRRAYLSWLARFGVAMLVVHVLIALVVLWPGVWQWSAGTQLRIYFLHNLLLGWVSSVLLALILTQIGAAQQSWTTWAAWAWIGGVGALLSLLLALGLLQFLPVPAPALLRAAAWSTLLPVVVAGSIWLASLRPPQLGIAGRTRGQA